MNEYRKNGRRTHTSEDGKDEPGIDETQIGLNKDEPGYGSSNFDNTRRLYELSQADDINDKAKRKQPYIKLFDR